MSTFGGAQLASAGVVDQRSPQPLSKLHARDSVSKTAAFAGGDNDDPFFCVTTSRLEQAMVSSRSFPHAPFRLAQPHGIVLCSAP